jgi:D-amino-acid dehydrogenase
MSATKWDVIIIGAGVVGLSVAYFAAAEGARVLVLEKGDIGSGSSSGNAGLVVPSHFEPLPGPGVIREALEHVFDPEGFFGVQPRLDPSFLYWLIRFAGFCDRKTFDAHSWVLTALNREALKIHLELAALGGKEYDFSRKGLLFLYLDRERFRKAKEKGRKAADRGITAEILSAETARTAEPSVGEQVVGGVRYLSDAGLNPLLFIEWLAKKAVALGATIKTHCEVYAFQTFATQAKSVLTTRGEFRADQIVLAAGAWLKPLGRLLGTRLPVEGGKGISQTFYGSHLTVKQPLLLDECHVAVSPLSGALRITGLLELVGIDLTLNPLRVRGIRRAASRYVPRVRGMEPDEVWRGLRPCTPDGLPLIGRLRSWNNVIVAGGHDTKGMSLGPVTGQYVSGILTGKGAGDLELAFSPGRFGC